MENEAIIYIYIGTWPILPAGTADYLITIIQVSLHYNNRLR